MDEGKWIPQSYCATVGLRALLGVEQPKYMGPAQPPKGGE